MESLWYWHGLMIEINKEYENNKRLIRKWDWKSCKILNRSKKSVICNRRSKLGKIEKDW
jgi:hypothetical protein